MRRNKTSFRCVPSSSIQDHTAYYYWSLTSNTGTQALSLWRLNKRSALRPPKETSFGQSAIERGLAGKTLSRETFHWSSEAVEGIKHANM